MFLKSADLLIERRDYGKDREDDRKDRDRRDTRRRDEGRDHDRDDERDFPRKKDVRDGEKGQRRGDRPREPDVKSEREHGGARDVTEKSPRSGARSQLAFISLMPGLTFLLSLRTTPSHLIETTELRPGRTGRGRRGG